MEYLIEIVKKLAVFYVLSTFLMNMVNDEKYKKYISMFVGIVIIIILIRPVGRLLSLDIKFCNLFDYNQTIQMSNELKNEIVLADEKMKEELLAEFNEKVKSDIDEYIRKYNVKLSDIKIEINSDGEIISMFLYISKSFQTPSVDIILEEYNPSKDLVVIEIKKYISEVYKINKNNIYVNISI